jgi:hypothetical protein
MSYIVQTPDRGLVLQPDTGWDGFAEHEFVIVGRCDASYHTCPDTGRSVSGWSIFLHGASTENKSKSQNWVTLSVTTECAQSLLFHYRLLCDLGLRVKLPMILEMDNKGARDVVCNWSAGGRLRHVDIRQYFLRDLKEDGLIWTTWFPSEDNSADVFTKNLAGPLFEKHIRTMLGLIHICNMNWLEWWHSGWSVELGWKVELLFPVLCRAQARGSRGECRRWNEV